MLFLVQGDDHTVYLSGVHPDSPEFENNNVELTDALSCRRSPDHRLPAETLIGILENVLRDAGVEFSRG